MKTRASPFMELMIEEKGKDAWLQWVFQNLQEYHMEYFN